MARFATTGQENAVTASLTTALALCSAATIRPAVDYFTGSASGTLADQAVRCAVMRFTAAPTVTAVVPVSLGADGSVSELATGTGENASAEGTVTSASEMFDQSIHLRSQAYWWASSEGARLVMPATASTGINFRCSSSNYTSTFDYTAHHVE
jgi:hypothetical protein